jgi:hypothetical protein
MKKLLALASLIVLGCVLLSVGANVPSAAPATEPLSAHQDTGPGQLLVPGDRVVIGYKLDSPGVKSRAGSLYVRNDLARVFEHLALTLKQDGSLQTVIPTRLIHGHRLLYYAVLRDPSSGRSLTVPAGGARSPQIAWIMARPFDVRLGTHVFGRLSAPQAVVAKAGPRDVGFPSPGEGCCGPTSFQVAPDRSVWLLDSGRQRLLVWPAGDPDVTAARTVALPQNCCEDFALGLKAALYVTQSGTPAHPLNFLDRLSPTGAVRWKGTLDAEGFPVQLRIGPDGTLYTPNGIPGLLEVEGVRAWTPATTPDGRPLSVAEQRRRALPAQPLSGGRMLVSSFRSKHEARFALIGRDGGVARGWRVYSRTVLESGDLVGTPDLVGGDPVVFFTVWTQTRYRAEYVVLRLAPTSGGTRARLTLGHRPPLAGWNDIVTDLRIGPDGKLYQMGTSPTDGVSIRRFSLGPTR